MNSTQSNAEAFVPEKDVTETLEDGRTIQVAAKGVPIPMVEAEKLGLVKGSAKTAESTKKAAEPTENKSATPASSKK
jgi:hypothetical protein